MPQHLYSGSDVSLRRLVLSKAKQREGVALDLQLRCCVFCYNVTCTKLFRLLAAQHVTQAAKFAVCVCIEYVCARSTVKAVHLETSSVASRQQKRICLPISCPVATSRLFTLQPAPACDSIFDTPVPYLQ